MTDDELIDVVGHLLRTALELTKQHRMEEAVELVEQAVEYVELAAQPTLH